MLGRVRYTIYSTNMIGLRDVTWRGVMAAYTTTNRNYSAILATLQITSYALGV